MRSQAVSRDALLPGVNRCAALLPSCYTGAEVEQIPCRADFFSQTIFTGRKTRAVNFEHKHSN